MRKGVLRIPTLWVLLTVTTLLHGTMALAAEAPPEGPVVVWHALQGPEQDFLYKAAERYTSTSGVAVEFAGFPSPDELYKAFVVARMAGIGPDILFGDHTMVPPLLEKGFIAGLCAEGGCPECLGSSAPPWCAYASNGQFGGFEGSLEDLMIPDFPLSPERCRLEGCGECDPSNGSAPPYCKYVSEGFKLDLLQASFADLPPGYDRPLLVGFPIFWNYIGVGFDRFHYQEQQLPEPKSFEDVVVLGQGGDSVYFDDDNGCGNSPPRWWPKHWPWPPPKSLIDESNILFFSSSRATALRNEVGELVMPVLGDFKTDVMVQGALLRAGTERRAQALDFMHELRSPDLQIDLFNSSGQLPVDRAALGGITPPVEGLVGSGKFGALALP